MSTARSPVATGWWRASRQSLAARALIPADASYHVAVAPGYEGGDELTQGTLPATCATS
jgi:hypothetical protein